MTNTQLGILERVLQLKKQRALRVTSLRAQEFQKKFLNMFKENRVKDIANFDNLLTARDEKDERNPRGDNLETLIERHYENRAIKTKQLRLLMDFQGHVLQKRIFPRGEGTLAPRPERFVERSLVNNPRLFAKVSFAFNTIGTLGGLGSIILGIRDLCAKPSIPAGIGVAATFLGAIGSWKSSLDFIKSIRKLITPNTPNSADVEEIPMQQLNRAADDIPVFDRLAAADFRVDLASTERVTKRLSKYFSEAATFETKLFLGLGVVADFAFLGISLYDIYKDSQAKKLDGWKLADDIGIAVSSTSGASVGKSVYNSYFNPFPSKGFPIDE